MIVLCFCYIAVVNIFDRCCIADSYLSHTCVKGATGAGFFNPCARAVTVAIVVLMQKSVEIEKLCGKNPTVRTIRVARV